MSQTSQSKSKQPKSATKPSARSINPALLKAWPLPGLSDEGDKETRGRVLVIAGSEGMPGAAVLAATCTLRAGAGKLQIAAPKSVASWIAVSVLESLVLSLPESKGGLSAAGSAKILKDPVKAAAAILIGPGMTGGPALTQLMKLLLPSLKDKILVLDAEALHGAQHLQKEFLRYNIQVVVTPHAGEMASLLDLEKRQIEKEPAAHAVKFATTSGIVTVLKGSETFIASPDGDLYSNQAGNVGLGVSGSGDTLSGIIAGLAARGATATQAAAWGVHLHACAGDLLAKRIGSVGYLPREIPQEIPALLDALAQGRRLNK
jgi:ADP-dependent NAD(P)H-hydrate dehydratase